PESVRARAAAQRQAARAVPLPRRRRAPGRQRGPRSLPLLSALGKPDGPHLRDTLPLKKEEWSAFAPPKLVAGAEWTIPADVARKLVRPFCLNTLGGDMPGPEDAKVAQLTAKVESVKDGRARIRLTGTFE